MTQTTDTRRRRDLRRRFRQVPLEAVQTRLGALFYVTARIDTRTVALLGPYISHMTALANVERGRRLAGERFPDVAPWASYGTASAPRQHKVRTRFGR